MPAHPYNEAARRLFAAAISQRLGVSLLTAYARHTPPVMSKHWLEIAEAVDRYISAQIAGLLLPAERRPAAPARPNLLAAIPASPRKQ